MVVWAAPSRSMPSAYPEGRSKGPAGRLSLADWENYYEPEPEGPGSYAFGYDIEDPETDNVQFRHEERHPNGTVRGSYGYVTPDGNVNIVNYIADALGYRATVETRSRGDLKPIKVNVEQEIADAQVKGEDTRKYVQPNYVDRTNLNRATFNNKEENYVVSNNLARAAVPVPNQYYQFYYTPLY
ncbi:PREDICTED: cuticle protein 21-like [Nicrophorus vespilloides]|uniref:Cuticle protein 21-like n=1 Tax=Nicrophorus vespilloides TaxID=110193 RepID=A0ABM1MXS2_NICVS|nr:PREDICTED: cuticle protein 21-like [Nicrophorus vespilloides]